MHEFDMQSANLNIDSGAAFGLYTGLLTNLVALRYEFWGFEPDKIREDKPPGMRVPGGFLVANSACGDFDSSAQKIDGIRTAIRIFGYEEDSSFCVGLMHVTSKVMRGFVNHCIEELVLTSGAIRPKTLCNQTGDCG